MSRFPRVMIRLASTVSAMVVLFVVPGWAQIAPSLPSRHAESPELRQHLAAAADDAALRPWQRKFMRELAGADAVGTVPVGAGDESGQWENLFPPPVRGLHSAIYDPVRDRMVVFGGYDGSNFNDTWLLNLSGTPQWSALVVPGPLPPARSDHVAIYDPVHDRMIVFGGSTGTAAYLNDVWALSLSGTPAWSELSPTGPVPPARGAHTAIYDPVRERMVVFGGTGNVAPFNDVWALDLSGTPAWSELSPAGSPPGARVGSAATYDPVRDRLIVFGGQGVDAYNDVWALSLAGTPAWSELTPTVGTGPTPRFYPTATYDPVHDQVVIFGGHDGGDSHPDDVWALSLLGTPAWSELSPTGTPPAGRTYHTSIYDPARDQVIVFGGADGVGFRNDAWALGLGDSPAWNELTPRGPLPSRRSQHSAVYDPVRDRMIVFGGSPAAIASPLNDVWALSLSGTPVWSELSPTGTPPSGRFGHTAVYDPARDRMLVFGGEDASNDVWALSLAGTPAWSELETTGTPAGPFVSHTAVHDPVHDRMIVFGGRALLSEVWVLRLGVTPAAWSELSLAGSMPTARHSHSAIYDPVRMRMIVFGGTPSVTPGSQVLLDDVWQLSLAGTPAWSELSPTGTPPPPRFGHSAIYDSMRDRMVVFSGRAAILDNDVWALSLAGTPAWTELAPTGTAPGWLIRHSAIYDTRRDDMIVFAGSRGNGVQDVWRLNWTTGDPGDNQLPDCSRAYASMSRLWPANHDLVPVTITGVTDPDLDPFTITVTGVTQDEPLSDHGRANTCPDARLTAGAVELRAERSGAGNGRVYTISFIADDGQGGSCNGAVTVCVPHHPGHPGSGQASCEDDGQEFDSLGPCRERTRSADSGGLRLTTGPISGRTVSLEYFLPAPSAVAISLYDIAGRRVAALEKSAQSAGLHQATWSLPNLASGIYFARLQADEITVSRSVMILR